MPKKHGTDLDERGLSPRDIIEGDVLTLVGYKKHNRRRVKLSEYLSGEFPTGHMRRTMGWILPSLDGDPPHPSIMRDLLKSQANANLKKERIAKEAKRQEEARERAKAKKAAKHAAWLERKAQVAQ